MRAPAGSDRLYSLEVVCFAAAAAFDPLEADGMTANRRPIILTFAHYYLPGYKGGGPVRSISNMVEGLSDQFEFRIVTADRDRAESEPYGGIPTGLWVPVGKASVLYLPPAQRRLSAIARLLREQPHDLLYLNSFFDPDFTLKPLLLRRLFRRRPPALLAPRGEMSEGSRRVKANKKKLFLAFARSAGLYRGLSWHASSKHDEADINRIIGANPEDIFVAPNLSAPAPEEAVSAFRTRAPGEPLRVCFISRISPEKNLGFAIEALGQVRSPVHFDIYGPIGDPAYWAACRKLIARLPASVSAIYRGSLQPQTVASTFAANDLFFLPTQGENFGHVITESLSVGTPVLIADTTPWRNLAEAGVGWDLQLATPRAFVEAVEAVAALSQDEQLAMRERVRAFAGKRRQDGNATAATSQLFFRAMGRSESRP